MPLIGTARPFEVPDQIKSILKLHGDYSFIPIPTKVLDKHQVKEFQVIDSENKITLVAQPASQATNDENESTSALKEIV